ncbi:hypothetical protein VE25_21500 [Devosia geojensis]|uniref:Uncharacterized protein n=1 Tax=Devosia geojensis TaxID=443610 RepID=A0A0F5FEZ0_9HYPH|nr:hypothetical protein [Devosia geojensis]KKB06742.1 hypothetical protein VE25_21500 [Devosia geojensis]
MAETYATGSIALLRTGWNSDAFAIVLDTPMHNPAGCPTADGYIAHASRPGYQTFLGMALSAYKAGRTISVVLDDRECFEGRPAMIGINAGPPPPRPAETRTVVLNVSASNENSSHRYFKDIPVIGTFTGHGISCYGGTRSPDDSAGWGQVEGTGHPDGGTDPCASWILRLAFDFDLAPITSVAGSMTIDRAILRYTENALPSAFCALVYTQGGFLVDPLPCWSNGQGVPEEKPDGCVVLRVPDIDWRTLPHDQHMPLTQTTFSKVEPRGAWDVTDLLHQRLNPGLQPPPELGGAVSLGVGYVLVGTPLDTANLSGDDNTRCSSHISDLRLEVTFTVHPDGEPGPIVR